MKIFNEHKKIRYCSSRKVSFHFLIMQLTSFFSLFVVSFKIEILFQSENQQFALKMPAKYFKFFTSFYSVTLSVFILLTTKL